MAPVINDFKLEDEAWLCYHDERGKVSREPVLIVAISGNICHTSNIYTNEFEYVDKYATDQSPYWLEPRNGVEV